MGGFVAFFEVTPGDMKTSMAWVVARWYLCLRDRKSYPVARSIRFEWDLGDPEWASSRVDEGGWSPQERPPLSPPPLSLSLALENDDGFS